MNFLLLFALQIMLLFECSSGKRKTVHKRLGFKANPSGLLPGAHLSPVYIPFNTFIHSFVSARGLFAPNATIPDGRTYTSMMNAVIKSEEFKNREELADFMAHALFLSKGLTQKQESRPDSFALVHSYHPRGYCPIEGEAAYRHASTNIFGDDRLVLVPELVAFDEEVNWRSSILAWKQVRPLNDTKVEKIFQVLKKDETICLPMDGLERLSLIGTGSFGKVYKCRDLTTGRFVAAKEINLDANEDCFDVLRGEIVALLACSHPNIIRYHRSFIPSRRGSQPLSPTLNRLCIVMDYCELGSLRQIIDANGPLPEKIVAEVAESILSALEYLHRQKISHRDLKAGNVLVDADGCIKLGDFGVALTDQSKLDKLAGSPYWMAPEVIKEGRYSTNSNHVVQVNPAAADIWSFGITLIELLKGRPPLHYLSPSAAMGMIPSTSPPRLESSDPHASKMLRDLIHACLHDDPLQRPTAAQLLKQYKNYFKAHKSSVPSILSFLKKKQEKPESSEDSKDSKDKDHSKDTDHCNHSKDMCKQLPQSNFSTALSGWDFEIGSTIIDDAHQLEAADPDAASATTSVPATPKPVSDPQLPAATPFPVLAPFHDRPTPKFALRSVHSDSLSSTRLFNTTSSLNISCPSTTAFTSSCNWNRKDQAFLPIPPPHQPPDLSRPQYEAEAAANESNSREGHVLRLMRLYLTEEERRPELSIQLRHFL